MGEWDAPVKPINVKKRRWLIILGIVSGSLALLLIVAYFIVTSAWFLKSVILPKAGAAFNATITVQDASISPFSSITLTKLQVQTTGGEPLLTAEQVHCRYSLWAILRGDIRVAEATLETPVVQLLQNADGTSNVDPFLKSSGSEPKAGSSQPLRLDLQQIAVKNGKLRYVKVLPSGGKQVAEISGLSLTADTVANARDGKVHVAADLKFDQGLGAATNGVASARLEGEFDFALDAKLRPASAKGSLKFNGVEASGVFRDAAEVSVEIAADVAFPEIHSLALRFFKSTNPLGALVVSGEFNPATLDGRLNLDLRGIDRQVLNIGGAFFGGDFNATTLTSSNVVVLAQGGKSVTLNGQCAVNKFSLSVKGHSTPTLDLNTTYDLTIDQPSKRVELRVLKIDAVQDQTTVLHGALTMPMTLDWGDGANPPEDSAFELALKNLNLADWSAFAPDLAPAGRFSLALNVAAQQSGKKLKLDFSTQLADFSARMASNRVEAVDATITLQAGMDDFTKIDLASLAVVIGCRKQPALNLGASGKVDLQTMDVDLQTKLGIQLPSLVVMLGNPAVSVSSGTLTLTNHIVQQNQSPGQTTNAVYNRGVVGSLRVDRLTGRLNAFNFDGFAVDADCDLSVKDQLAEVKKLSATLRQGGQPGGTFEVTGAFDLGKTNGQVALHLVDLNQSVVRSFAAPLPDGSKLESVSISLDAVAGFDPQAESAVKGEFRVENLVLTNSQRQLASAPTALLLKLDAGLKDNLAELRQCAGSFRQGGLSGGSFEASGQFNLKTKTTRAALKLNGLNQNILQPLLASALGDKTLSSASININADASYDPKGESAVKGEFQMTDFLLTDPQGLLPKTPLTAVVKLDGSLRDNLAEIRQFVGSVKQGDLPGGSFDIKGDYHLTRHGGQLEVRLTDLNQNALAPLLSGALGAKKLESVSINLSASARCEPEGESKVKGELRVVNLLLKDAAGESPTNPLKFALQIDSSLTKQVLDLRMLQFSIDETARAKQQLRLSGTLDFARSNGVAGDLKLTAESLDLTPCYEMFASRKPATNQVERASTPAASAATSTEPGPIQLPVGRVALDAAIRRLYLREIEVANFAAIVRIETNSVAIDPFKLTLNGAPVSLRASANLGVPGYEYDVNLSANRIPLEPLLNSFDPAQRGQVKGLLTVSTTIKGAGITGASLQKHLAGDASLTVTNASIRLAGNGSGSQGRGTSLTTFFSAIFKPVSVLLRLPDMTQSPLDSLDAHAEVSAGTVKLESLLLQSAAFQATSAGTISLADPVSASRLNDLPVGIALERSTLARVGLASTNTATDRPYARLPDFCKVGGTFANPEVKTDAMALSRGLLKTCAEAALQGVLGGGAAGALGVGAAGALGGVLSGANPAASGAVPGALKGGADVPKVQAPSLPQVPTASVLTNAIPKKPSALDLLKSGKSGK